MQDVIPKGWGLQVNIPADYMSTKHVSVKTWYEPPEKGRGHCFTATGKTLQEAMSNLSVNIKNGTMDSSRTPTS